MITITCYKTTQEQLPKAFCLIAEKCYYSNLKTNVITMNDDYSKILDRVLWTYSKKHFIPHATNLDPSPEKQAVFISDNIKDYNNSEIVFLINPDESRILQTIESNGEINIKSLKKVIFLFDEFQKITHNQINLLLEKSSITDFNISAFDQNIKGSWEKVI